jgi:hypothetical protein
VKRALVALAHPGHAGMLRALAVLDAAAPRHGWELTYVLSGKLPAVAAGELPAARTLVLPGIGRWRRWPARLVLPATVSRLARLARGADVLYSCTLSSFPYCLLAGRLAGRPAVVHVYSSYATARPYRKHLLARARDLVAPSADSLRLAREALGGFRPGTRARVVYNGMDVAGIAAAAAGPLPAGLGRNGRPRIGMVGNLDERKDPALVVEVARLVREAVPGVQVLLVGAFAAAAYERRVRERIDALGLADTVTVTGFLPNPFSVVASLDVLVHAAHRDPFPLALLEAMALGRPIVATAVGGIPEMLVDGESGLLVPAGDAAALAHGVVSLLRDEGRRAALGAAAYHRLTTEFTLERFAAGMFGAFAGALAAAP